MELTNNQKINEFYSEALSFIQRDDYKNATKVLYNSMPEALYDQSMDILFNRNTKTIDDEFKELRELIKMVDDKLVEFSTNDEVNEEIVDHFNGDIF